MRWAWLALSLAAAQEVKRPIVTTDLIHGVLDMLWERVALSKGLGSFSMTCTAWLGGSSKCLMGPRRLTTSSWCIMWRSTARPWASSCHKMQRAEVRDAIQPMIPEAGRSAMSLRRAVRIQWVRSATRREPFDPFSDLSWRLGGCGEAAGAEAHGLGRLFGQQRQRTSAGEPLFENKGVACVGPWLPDLSAAVASGAWRHRRL